MYVDGIQEHGSSPYSDMLFYIFDKLFFVFSVLMSVPVMIIYGLFPPGKSCPSAFDIFVWLTFGFLFYTFIIWGIMKFIKKCQWNPKVKGINSEH
jgi:hypothetical protein